MSALMKLFKSQFCGRPSGCRAELLAAEFPPSVRPPEENAEPGAAPASFTAFSTAAERAGGLAPWIVSMTVPLRRIRKVGMLLTLYCDAMSRCWSTSIFANVILLGLENLVDSDSKVGAIILQGPHHVA